jgi:hypothetical protein
LFSADHHKIFFAAWRRRIKPRAHPEATDCAVALHIDFSGSMPFFFKQALKAVKSKLPSSPSSAYR